MPRPAPPPLDRRVKRASSPRGRRAFGPGSRVGRLAFACLAVAVLAAALAVTVGRQLTRPDGSPARYGGLPSWLPKPTAAVGRVVEASPGHPRLAVEGDKVLVQLAGGKVLATAVGPAVPEEGQFPVPPTSPCTFTVTLVATSGAVPVRGAAFTILDELGRLHHPQVSAQGGGPPPADVTPGRTVTLAVKDVLPTGSGQLRWAPGQAGPIVSWDFDVEID
jgi:hypothetical protein